MEQNISQSAIEQNRNRRKIKANEKEERVCEILKQKLYKLRDVFEERSQVLDEEEKKKILTECAFKEERRLLQKQINKNYVRTNGAAHGLELEIEELYNNEPFEIKKYIKIFELANKSLKKCEHNNAFIGDNLPLPSDNIDLMDDFAKCIKFY